MFGRKRMEREIADLNWRLDRSDKRYLETKANHDLLLVALGLKRKKNPEKIEYVKA